MSARIRITVKRGGIPVGPSTDEVSIENVRKGDEIVCESIDSHTTYNWSLVFTPDSPNGTISSSGLIGSPLLYNCTFVIDHEGAYLIRLVVDAGLATESTQFLRVRMVTRFGDLKLVSAGERRDSVGAIPADIDPVGWADNQNQNLQKLLAYVRRLSTSGRVLYVDANRGRKAYDPTQNANDTTNMVEMPGPDASDLTVSGVVTDAEGFADFSSISSAIDYARDCASRGEPVLSADHPYVILVQNGVYTEDVHLLANIHLVSADNFVSSSDTYAKGVVVQSNNLTGGHTFIGVNNTDSVVCVGIEFQTANTGSTDPTFQVKKGIAYFIDCTISHLAGTGLSALRVVPVNATTTDECSAYLINSYVQNTVTNANDYAIKCGADCSYLVLKNSVVVGQNGIEHNVNYGGGLKEEAHLHIMHSTVMANNATGYAVLTNASDLKVEHSYVVGSDATKVLVIGQNQAKVGDIYVKLAFSEFYNAHISFDTRQITGVKNLQTSSCLYDSYIFPDAPPTFSTHTQAKSLKYENNYADPFNGGTLAVPVPNQLGATDVQDAIDDLAFLSAILGAFGTFNSLDVAYDGVISVNPPTLGSGDGRRISADQGAVVIQSATAPYTTTPVSGTETTPLTSGDKNGYLQVEGNIELGKIDSAEMSFISNYGTIGSMLSMGSVTWNSEIASVAGGVDHRSLPSAIIQGNSDKDGLLHNYNVRVQTKSTSNVSNGSVGWVVLQGGDSLEKGANAPHAGDVYIQGGSYLDSAFESVGGNEPSGSVHLIPGTSTSIGADQPYGYVKVINPTASTSATLLASAFPNNPTTCAGEISWATPMGVVTATITVGMTPTDVVNAINNATVGAGLIFAQITSGFISLTCVSKGVLSDVVYVGDTDSGNINADLGDFQISSGAVFTAGTDPQYVNIHSSALHEITIGEGGTTGPMIYNSDTGKLTVPGLLDPTGLIFVEENQNNVPTGANEGAIFVSDGTDGLVQNKLYFKPANNGAPIDLTAGFGGNGTYGDMLYYDPTNTLVAQSGVRLLKNNNLLEMALSLEDDGNHDGGSGPTDLDSVAIQFNLEQQKRWLIAQSRSTYGSLINGDYDLTISRISNANATSSDVGPSDFWYGWRFQFENANGDATADFIPILDGSLNYAPNIGNKTNRVYSAHLVAEGGLYLTHIANQGFQNEITYENVLKVDSTTPTAPILLFGSKGSEAPLAYQSAVNTNTTNITNLTADVADKIELTDLSVSLSQASGNGSLTYDNTTGIFTFTPADVSGGGLSGSGTQYQIPSFDNTGSLVGTANLLHTVDAQTITNPSSNLLYQTGQSAFGNTLGTVLSDQNDINRNWFVGRNSAGTYQISTQSTYSDQQTPNFDISTFDEGWSIQRFGGDFTPLQDETQKIGNSNLRVSSITLAGNTGTQGITFLKDDGSGGTFGATLSYNTSTAGNPTLTIGTETVAFLSDLGGGGGLSGSGTAGTLGIFDGSGAINGNAQLAFDTAQHTLFIDNSGSVAQGTFTHYRNSADGTDNWIVGRTDSGELVFRTQSTYSNDTIGSFSHTTYDKGWSIDTNGNFIPTGNGALDIGSNANRVQSIYVDAVNSVHFLYEENSVTVDKALSVDISYQNPLNANAIVPFLTFNGQNLSTTIQMNDTKVYIDDDNSGVVTDGRIYFHNNGQDTWYIDKNGSLYNNLNSDQYVGGLNLPLAGVNSKSLSVHYDFTNTVNGQIKFETVNLASPDPALNAFFSLEMNQTSKRLEFQGNQLAYNSEISASGIAYTDLSVTTSGSPSGGGSLSYNNTNGTFTFTPAVTDSITDGTTTLDFDGSNNLQLNGHFLPTANITYDLGSTSLRWRTLYLDGNTIFLGDSSISLNATDPNDKHLEIDGTRLPTKFEHLADVDGAGTATTGHVLKRKADGRFAFEAETAGGATNMLEVGDSSFRLVDPGASGSLASLKLDNVNILQFTSSSLYPQTTDTYDLGTSTKTFAQVHTKEIELYQNGSSTPSGTLSASASDTIGTDAQVFLTKDHRYTQQNNHTTAQSEYRGVAERTTRTGNQSRIIHNTDVYTWKTNATDNARNGTIVPMFALATERVKTLSVQKGIWTKEGDSHRYKFFVRNGQTQNTNEIYEDYYRLDWPEYTLTDFPNVAEEAFGWTTPTKHNSANCSFLGQLERINVVQTLQFQEFLDENVRGFGHSHLYNAETATGSSVLSFLVKMQGVARIVVSIVASKCTFSGGNNNWRTEQIASETFNFSGTQVTGGYEGVIMVDLEQPIRLTDISERYGQVTVEVRIYLRDQAADDGEFLNRPIDYFTYSDLRLNLFSS